MPPPNKKSKIAHERNMQGAKGFQKQTPDTNSQEEEAQDSDSEFESDNEFFQSDWDEVTKLLNEEVSKLERGPYYRGDSERTKRRKEQAKREMAQSMAGSKTLKAYWSPLLAKSNEDTESSKKEVVQSKLTIEQALEQLDDGVGRSKPSNEGVLAYEHARLLTLRLYFERILNGETKGFVSEQLAEQIWRKGPHQARRICEWGNEFLTTGALSRHRQGTHAKIDPLIDNENFSIACKEWLRITKVESRSPLELKMHIEKVILPDIENSRKTISESTCREYMKKWGYTFGAHAKDVYMDGHEREDVQIYRTQFVKRMLDLEPRMSTFIGEEMVQKRPTLRDGEKEVVMVTHDECAFHAYDAQSRMWMAEGEQLLRKKGAGKTLMVSGFMCPCHGVVHMKEFEPGKNCDGYWTSAHMVDHVSGSQKRSEK